MNKAFKEEIKTRMEKKAFNPFSRKPPIHRSLGGFAAKGALIAAGALGTEMIAEGVIDWWRERRKDKERGPLFEGIIEKHPELKEYPYAKVLMYFDTLFAFSPSLARDPLAAGAFIRQAIRMDEFGGPGHETIKNLATIEKSQAEIAEKGKPRYKSVGA
jgi:hypothetical protein